MHSDVKGRLGLDAPDVTSSYCFATWSLVQSRVEIEIKSVSFVFSALCLF